MMIRLLFIAIVVALCVTSHAQERSSIDGSGNNLNDSDLNRIHTSLTYQSAIDYADGISEPSGTARPNPRTISNRLFVQEDVIDNSQTLSNYIWVFGQFIDHDIIFVDEDHTDFFPIRVPEGDEFFETGSLIPMSRSKAMDGTGTSPENPRIVANDITGWIDGSSVYGSDLQTSNWLRSFNSGKLKTSSGNLLPWNTMDGEIGSQVDDNAPVMADNGLTKYFVAGDLRANENVLLTSMHTLWMREHNRWCDQLSSENPSWDDERLYQEARRRVSAIIQHITYDEWLPAMGIELGEYAGYDDQIDAAITNTFSTAAFRLGHTLLSSEIVRSLPDGTEHPDGNLTLSEAFFNPLAIIESDGLDPLLKGLGSTMHQEADCKVVDDVRNFLFGPPSAGGLDLASINIQRARERGLKDFNGVREDFGLPAYQRWSDINDDTDVIVPMAQLYADINEIDPWVGMLAEGKEAENTLFGETINRIVGEQFKKLRDGDRFYYENDPALTNEEISQISNTRMYDVLMRNTDIEIMQKNVFSAMEHKSIPGAQVYLIEKNLDLVTFPNPAQDFIYVKVFTRESKKLNLTIRNSLGQVVITESFTTTGGRFVHDTPISQLAPGYYEYILSDNVEFNSSLFIKQ